MQKLLLLYLTLSMNWIKVVVVFRFNVISPCRDFAAEFVGLLPNF